MTQRHITIIAQQGPYANSAGQDALDFAMAMANFGQHVNLVFMHDGVFQLLANQHAESIFRKDFTKCFAALTYYDIEPIYVCQRSLAARNVSPNDLIVGVETLDEVGMQALFKTPQHLVTF
ncbi:MAG: sulfurtransferase complex subunit TusC [Paraglaciecola sp.]|nr:sulfurtransferase complex subunit TusC [Paraglaciecola sp.]NCT48552.1 sulfurtransferase complex subunit TusC [Paraglaciecola sp.]